jgi:hypothetical protein
MTPRDVQQSVRPAKGFGTEPSSGEGKNAATLPFALTLTAIILFVPEELSFYIVGLRFTAIRILFLVLTPLLLKTTIQKLSTGRYRFVFSDLFVALAGFWMIYAPAVVDDIGSALNHAGPDVLEFCVGYMTTRILLSKHGHALSFASLLCQVIAVVALIGLLDPLANDRLIKDFANRLTGYYSTFPIVEDDFRFGLMRAIGPMEHPILYGYVCAIGLLIAGSIPIRSRRFVMVSCCLGVIFSFSSAGFLAILLGISLLSYNRIMSAVSFRWLALISAGIIVIVAFFQISDNPMGFVFRHLIFDAQSGWYRYWTWQLVTFHVSQSPWYGLGYRPLPDEINHSIDSLWLVLSLRHGYAGAVLFALSLIGAASLPTSGRKIDLTSTESKLGTLLGILIFLTIFMSFTVDLWGKSWILCGLLIGMKAHLGELGHLGSRAARNVAGRVQSIAPQLTSSAGRIADWSRR